MKERLPVVEPLSVQHDTPQTLSEPAREPWAERRRNAPGRVRLGLVRRAPSILRRHVVRDTRRFVVLLLADLGTYYVMRALLRAVRDYAALGTAVADRVQGILPKGILNGWQFAAALLVGLLVTGNYRPGDARRNPRTLFAACALAAALPLWMTIWTRGLEVVAVQYALTAGLVGLGLVVQRLTLDQLVARVVRPERTASGTLFVGPAEECREAMASPAFRPGSEFRALGMVDVHIPPVPGALGHIVDFPRLLHESRAETVVVCGYLTDARFQDVVDSSLAAGCQLLSVPRSVDLAGVQPMLVWRHGQPLIELSAPNLKGQQLFVKRLLDLVGAVVGLVVLSPLLALCAALVRLDSPGPVFFSQERVGRGGGPFRIWKFRTMGRDAEQRRAALQGQSVYKDGRLFKIPDDPRITKIGRWLRRSSLDELPQLWNVLRGDMSLVGPRPPLPSEVALYEAHHYARFDVKPGMTGPWQVAGRNEIDDFESVIRLERDYIRDWSLTKDFVILLKTAPAVFRMNGAH